MTRYDLGEITRKVVKYGTIILLLVAFVPFALRCLQWAASQAGNVVSSGIHWAWSLPGPCSDGNCASASNLPTIGTGGELIENGESLSKSFDLAEDNNWVILMGHAIVVNGDEYTGTPLVLLTLPDGGDYDVEINGPGWWRSVPGTDAYVQGLVCSVYATAQTTEALEDITVKGPESWGSDPCGKKATRTIWPDGWGSGLQNLHTA